MREKWLTFKWYAEETFWVMYAIAMTPVRYARDNGPRHWADFKHWVRNDSKRHAKMAFWIVYAVLYGIALMPLYYYRTKWPQHWYEFRQWLKADTARFRADLPHLWKTEIGWKRVGFMAAFMVMLGCMWLFMSTFEVRQ